MTSKKWITVGSLGVFLCATVVALGQQHQPATPSAGRYIVPETPAQKAREDNKWRLDQAAIKAQDEGDFAEAEDDARQSLSLGQDSGIALEVLASSLNAQGKTQEALKVYKMMADAGNVFPRNLVPYAVLSLKAGHWAEAVNAYNKTLLFLPNGQLVKENSQFSPDVPQPKQFTVALHVAQGLTYDGDPGLGTHSRHEEAMREFDQALRLAPKSALTNYYYGFGWQRLDRNSPTRAANAWRAKAALQKASSLDNGKVKRAAEEALTRIP